MAALAAETGFFAGPALAAGFWGFWAAAFGDEVAARVAAVFLSAAMRLTGLGGGIVPPEAGFYPSPGAQPRFASRSRSR